MGTRREHGSVTCPRRRETITAAEAARAPAHHRAGDPASSLSPPLREPRQAREVSASDAARPPLQFAIATECARPRGRPLDAARRCARARPSQATISAGRPRRRPRAPRASTSRLGSAPRSERPLAARNRPVTTNAVRLLPSGNEWFRAERWPAASGRASSSVG